MAVSHVFSNGVADATGTMTVWFGATTATVAATDVIKPSDWNSAHNQIVTLSGNTAGVSTISGTNIVFGGSNNVTLSGIQGANAATINVSAAAGGGGGSVNVSAGTTSNNLTNFVFADGNGVSFGLNGSTVTATVATNYQSAGAYLTTARASNDAIGLATAQSNVTWTANSAGLSLDARGYAGTGTTFNGANISGSITQNSNGIQLSLSAGAGGAGDGVNILAAGTQTANTTGTVLFNDGGGVTFGMANSSVITATVRTDYLSTQSNQNITAANGGFAFQTLSFSNLNGISFGTSAGSAITASHNAITTGRASNDGIGLNTAQSNVTWTVNSSGLSLDARGYAGTATGATNASVTVNSGGVSVSVGNYITTARASTDAIGLNTAQSNVTWTVNSSGLSLDARGYAGTNTTFNGANVSGSMTVNSAGVNLSLSAVGAGTINQTGPNIGVSNLGNTAGSTGTVSTGNVVLAGSNGITLSQSTGGAGSNATITILGVGGLMSRHWGPDGNNLTFVTAPSNATASVNMFQIPYGLTATRVELPVYQSLASSATANTYGQQWSIYVMVLTNDSANSRLMSLSSGSTQTTYTIASNTAGQTQLNGSGIRPISCPINLSMTPGQYFVALNWVTNTFSSGTATTALARTVSILGNPAQSASYAMVADYSAATGVTNNSFMPAGVFSAASTGLPGTISYSQFTMTGASRSAANFALLFRG